MVFTEFDVSDGGISIEQVINSDDISSQLSADMDRCCVELLAEVDSNCSIVNTGSYAQVKSLLERQLNGPRRCSIPGSPFEFSLGDPGIAVDNAFYEHKSRSQFMVWYRSQPVAIYTLIRSPDRMAEAGVFGALAGSRLARKFHDGRAEVSDDRSELQQTAQQIVSAAPAVLSTEVAHVSPEFAQDLRSQARAFTSALFQHGQMPPA